MRVRRGVSQAAVDHISLSQLSQPVAHRLDSRRHRLQQLRPAEDSEQHPWREVVRREPQLLAAAHCRWWVGGQTTGARGRHQSAFCRSVWPSTGSSRAVAAAAAGPALTRVHAALRLLHNQRLLPADIQVIRGRGCGEGWGVVKSMGANEWRAGTCAATLNCTHVWSPAHLGTHLGCGRARAAGAARATARLPLLPPGCRTPRSLRQGATPGRSHLERPVPAAAVAARPTAAAARLPCCLRPAERGWWRLRQSGGGGAAAASGGGERLH